MGSSICTSGAVSIKPERKDDGSKIQSSTRDVKQSSTRDVKQSSRDVKQSSRDVKQSSRDVKQSSRDVKQSSTRDKKRRNVDDKENKKVKCACGSICKCSELYDYSISYNDAARLSSRSGEYRDFDCENSRLKDKELVRQMKMYEDHLSFHRNLDDIYNLDSRCIEFKTLIDEKCSIFYLKDNIEAVMIHTRIKELKKNYNYGEAYTYDRAKTDRVDDRANDRVDGKAYDKVKNDIFYILLLKTGEYVCILWKKNQIASRTNVFFVNTVFVYFNSSMENLLAALPGDVLDLIENTGVMCEFYNDDNDNIVSRVDYL